MCNTQCISTCICHITWQATYRGLVVVSLLLPFSVVDGIVWELNRLRSFPSGSCERSGVFALLFHAHYTKGSGYSVNAIEHSSHYTKRRCLWYCRHSGRVILPATVAGSKLLMTTHQTVARACDDPQSGLLYPCNFHNWEQPTHSDTATQLYVH